MIQLYSGTPGSGKSLHIAERIYMRMKNGRETIGNFDINRDKIKGKIRGKYLYLRNDKLTPKVLYEYSNNHFKNKPIKEGELVLIIDECQLLFNAREWNIGGRRDWLEFFTIHRHFGYDVILACQFDRMIDRQIRSLIEYEYIHRKASNFGMIGLLMKFMTLGELFVCVKYWYPIKEKVGSEFFKAKKKYYSIYDTFANMTTSVTAIAETIKVEDIKLDDE